MVIQYHRDVLEKRPSLGIVLYCGRIPAANGHRMHCSRKLIVLTLVFGHSYLHRQLSPPETLVVKGGTIWKRNDWWILPENARLPRNVQGSFTCRKSTTWDKRLYFLFFGKEVKLRPGLNPWTWVPKASTLPLGHRSRWAWVYFASGQKSKGEQYLLYAFI